MATAADPRADELATWLGGLGLEKYTEAFHAQDIDLRALPYLTEADLLQLGVSLGHRRILLAAIAHLPSQALLSAVSVSGVHSQPVPQASDQAERRLVSVLFCDMVGSTELARRLDPEDLRQLLRDYQDRVAGAVARYGGHLAQYLGDGVMASSDGRRPTRIRRNERSGRAWKRSRLSRRSTPSLSDGSTVGSQLLRARSSSAT